LGDETPKVNSAIIQYFTVFCPVHLGTTYHSPHLIQDLWVHREFKS